jgi:hypothetical protein
MDGRADFRSLLRCISIACVLINGASAFASQGNAECLITADQRGGMFVVKVTVRSPSAISGAYRLAATKRNEGGTSQTIQQGQFDLPQGGERQISAIAFEAAAAGHVTVSTRLNTDQGDVSCSFPE